MGLTLMETLAAAVISYHQCLAVTCTACGSRFGDGFVQHFDSVPDALAALADDEWAVTPEGVLCGACLPDCDAGVIHAPMVLRCEYCWPPLYSDGPLPERCVCGGRGGVVTHLQLPFISAEHPGFAVSSCVTLRCGDCGDGLGADDDRGDPHHRSVAEALDNAAQDYDWLITERFVCCGGCAKQRQCALLGHHWPEVAECVDNGIEHRRCQHCDVVAKNPVGDRSMPWL